MSEVIDFINVICPECKDGYFCKKGNSEIYHCSNCNEVLSCPFCASESTLSFGSGKVKFLHCSKCKSRYWGGYYEGKIEGVVNKIEGDSAAILCPKCGGSKIYDLSERRKVCFSCYEEFALDMQNTKKKVIESGSVERLVQILLETCPVCKGRNIVATDDGLKCNSCTAQWSVDPIKVKHNTSPEKVKKIKRSRKNKGDQQSESSRRSCPKCRKFYKDQTQVAGLCKDCKGENNRQVICPDCHSATTLSEGDFFCQCESCESVYPVTLAHSFKSSQSENFIRRYEKCKTKIEKYLSGILDIAAELGNDVPRNGIIGKLISELETKVESLAECHDYLDQGGELFGEVSDEDDDEELDESSLWNTDEDVQRWREFDAFHRLQECGESHYHEVVLTDAGSDLESDITVVEEVCPKCCRILPPSGVCLFCDGFNYV